MNNLNPCALCSAQTTRTTKNNTNVAQTNYILETVRNIDRMQREVVSETGCTNCNDLLVSPATLYNTKPVIFRFGNGEAFTAIATYNVEYIGNKQFSEPKLMFSTSISDYKTANNICN